jgi:hypothetical protein
MPFLIWNLTFEICGFVLKKEKMDGIPQNEKAPWSFSRGFLIRVFQKFA